jgi:hypothetical protein
MPNFGRLNRPWLGRILLQGKIMAWAVLCKNQTYRVPVLATAA